jgi:uncharacterized protein (TIGR02996 family)
MKHPENPALLAAVIADAEDDAPRLVYADWLEEHGDPDRAAFIRNQCALFDKSPGDPDYVDLTERRPEVSAALWRRQLGPQLPEAVGFHDNIWVERDDTDASYHRGFPYFTREPDVEGEVGARHARAFRDAWPEVIATTTLRGLVCFGGFERHLAEILSSPAAAHLSALSAPNDTAGTVDAILASPAAGALRWLDLTYLTSAADVDRLARTRGLTRMLRLEVSWLECPPAALRRLTAADWFAGLRRITTRLRGENEAAGVADLARLPELHTLELEGVTAEGMAAFAGRGRFPALGRLFVQAGRLRGAGAAALGRARLPKLAALELVGCGLRNNAVTVLRASGLLEPLRVLSLANNMIGDKGVAALADGPWPRRLRVLRLGHNDFGKRGLATLARPGAFPELTTLDLSASLNHEATPEDVTRFLTELGLPRLRHLSLLRCRVDDAGVKALAANPTLANLTSLDLGSCPAGRAGAKALFESANLRRLVTLKLSYSRMGKAVEMLKDPALLPNLRECWVPERLPDKLKERLEAARNVAFI